MKKETLTLSKDMITMPMDADRTNVEYFILKLKRKMFGEVPSVIAWWIDGIGELETWEKLAIFNGASEVIAWEARDRQAEHGDFPDWIESKLKKYIV